MTNSSQISSFRISFCPAGWRDWFFLEITTISGEFGTSEFTESHGPKYGLISTVHELSSQIVGQDCRNVMEILSALRRRNRQSLGGSTWKAISAIENALWDLWSKIEGVLISEILELGGSATTNKWVPSYWSHCGTTRVRAASAVFKQPIRNLTDLWELGSEVEQLKFQAFKTNLIDFRNEAEVLMPGFSREFKSSRLVDDSFNDYLDSSLRAFTHNGELSAKPILDWNYNVDPDSYCTLLETVAEFEPRWVEIDFNTIVDLEKLPNSNPVKICTGENLLGIDAYEPYFQSSAISVISIDLLWNGLSESIKIAKRAHAMGKNFTIHNYYSHFATSMALTFGELVPGSDLLEYDMDDVPWRDAIVEREIILTDGQILLESHLGWGNTIQSDVISSLSSPATISYRKYSQYLDL